MTRRCLREVDLIRQKRGDGGDEQRATGCVMVVDFKNAGFKNIVSNELADGRLYAWAYSLAPWMLIFRLPLLDEPRRISISSLTS